MSSNNDNHLDETSDHSVLDEVIAEYIRACEAGQPPDRDELLAAHPDLAEELREFFTNRDQMDQVARPMRNLVTKVLNVRCPHCHNPIELLDRAMLDDISCPSCGSSFSLVGEGSESPHANGSKMLGQFELLDQVGIGAFGSVWKARDTKLDRTVAIKIPRRGQLNGSETEMFLRDARATAQLKHPNIVGVHEVGRQNSAIYIVSDFIEGATLKQWLDTKRLTPREVAELCVKIAKALHHAHEAGVIHRDLKPGNIMMDADGEPHIVDFGLAKREAGEITMTVEGQILGTPAYMPPEQARGEGYKVDRRADIYSLGVILFELLTGELPFRGEKQMLIVQILKDDPPSARKLDSAVPRDLDTICLKCMEKEPAKRYESGLDLAHDLERFAYGKPILARPITRTERTLRWCKRNPVVSSLTAATLFLLVVVAVVTTLAYFREAVLRDEAEVAQEQADGALADFKSERERSGKLTTNIAGLKQQKIDLDRQIHELDGQFQVKLEEGERKQFETFLQLARRAFESKDVALADYYLNKCPDRFRDSVWDDLKLECYPHVTKFEGERCVALSPDGLLIAAASGTNKIKVWEIESGRLLHEFDNNEALVNVIRFSPDGSKLASCSGLQVLLWDLRRGEITQSFEGHSCKVTDIDFSPDGKHLASASYHRSGRKGKVNIWNIETGQSEQTIPGMSFAVFSHDGRFLATRNSRKITIWDLSKTIGDASSAFFVIPLNVARRPRFHPHKNVLAVAGDWYQRSVELWDIPSKKRTFRIPTSGKVTCHTFSQDGKRLAIGISTNFADPKFRTVIWNLVTEEVERILPWHLNEVKELAFQQSKPKLATAERNKIKLWDVTAPHDPTQDILDDIGDLQVGKLDWPQWGGSRARVNTPMGKNIPSDWDVGTMDRKTRKWSGSRNVKWVANLGSQTYGNPVVANGRVFVGTNNMAGHVKRYPFEIDLGVLLCFEETTGKFLWQHSNEKLPTGRVHDWEQQGICSTPLVDGDRLWYVSSRGEVVCLDTKGYYDDEDDGPIKNESARVFNVPSGIPGDDSDKELAPTLEALGAGKLSDYARAEFARVGFELPDQLAIEAGEKANTWLFTAKVGDSEREFFARKEGPKIAFYVFTTPDDKLEADVVWRFNMMTELGVSQHNMANCSVLTADGMLFVCTSNGCDGSHLNIPAPEAPSFLAMDRETGKVIWTDNSPGTNILHAQWGSPSYGVFDGQPQVIFPGGDGWVYSFDPKGDGKGESKLLWKFDGNPKESKWILGGRGTRNNIIAFPAIYDGLVYIVMGQDPEHGEGIGHLWCIDPTKHTDGSDISAELAFDRNGNAMSHRRLQAVTRWSRIDAKDLALVVGLDEGVVSEELRNAIASSGVSLPQALSVEVITEWYSWMLSSAEDNSHLIRINVHSYSGAKQGVRIERETGEYAAPNPKSAVVWHYSQQDRNGDGKFSFEETFHRSLSIPAIKDNILYIADYSGLFHCLNAKTGKVYWTYDMFAQCWGSPLLVDDKVYIGDEDGDVTIFPHTVSSRPALEARETEDGRIEYGLVDGLREGIPINEINMESSVYMTPIVANNVLYIASRSYLFAIQNESEQVRAFSESSSQPKKE